MEIDNQAVGEKVLHASELMAFASQAVGDMGEHIDNMDDVKVWVRKHPKTDSGKLAQAYAKAVSCIHVLGQLMEGAVGPRSAQEAPQAVFPPEPVQAIAPAVPTAVEALLGTPGNGGIVKYRAANTDQAPDEQPKTWADIRNLGLAIVDDVGINVINMLYSWMVFFCVKGPKWTQKCISYLLCGSVLVCIVKPRVAATIFVYLLRSVPHYAGFIFQEIASQLCIEAGMTTGIPSSWCLKEDTTQHVAPVPQLGFDREQAAHAEKMLEFLLCIISPELLKHL